MSLDELNKIKPVVYPLIWLTYKQRIRRDLDRVCGTDEGDSYFDHDYFAALCTQAKQLDESLVKLLVLQFALSAFQVLGFISSDASISLFGVTLKQATGVKEAVLFLYALVALATWTITISRDTSLAVIERLIELNTDESLSNFGKIAAPTFFGIKVYVPRAHEDWIFPTIANKGLFVAISLLAILLTLTTIGLSFTINVLFFIDIYHHPTLGRWSNWILAFVSLTFLFGILFIVRFYCPLPYRDHSSLLDLEALEKVDAALYIRKRAEIFGPESAYRRYTWSHRARAALTYSVGKLRSATSAFWSWVTRLQRQ